MGWEVLLVAAVEEWALGLDSVSYEQLAAALDLLGDVGPALGRPIVDRVKGSRLHNLKELRPGSSGASELRVLFVFDPRRRAVLLVAGDKAGAWRRWYAVNIPLAEQRYDEWLSGADDDE